MSLIITGNGTAGSWKVRGEQLGKAINAIIVPNIKKCFNEDVILVKKGEKCNLKGARTVIWDVVDYFPQPEAFTWNKDKLVRHIHKSAKMFRAAHLIAATEQMAKDLGTPHYLYHHGRTYDKPNPIRAKVRKIGYEGGPYLGEWEAILKQECQKRGWQFVINPKDLREVDILVALRGSRHSGYASLNWKSNVKLANAQTSGTPIILNREQGYRETASGGEVWADNVEELTQGFDLLTDAHERGWRSTTLQKEKPSLDVVSKNYMELLQNILRTHT